MTHPFSALSCRRLISGILAVMIGLGPLATPAYAAVTALADEPINVQNKAQPNIMLTVDDSTSMLFDFLPDNIVGDRAHAAGKYCRDITGKMGAFCGFDGQNTNLTTSGRGKYVTPGYIYQQAGVPFPAYSAAFDASGPGASCDLATRCSLTHADCSPVDPLRCSSGADGTCSADFASRCSVSHAVCAVVGDSCGVGAGICETGATCSSGIDPGPLPGLERYPNPSGPPPAKSPSAGKPYEYWTLWPAPVHNGEFNHVYYNPRLTYDAPVHADGTPYPDMNSGNSFGWTQVPADPWALPIKLIDLTAKVTVGLWCNSDWSLGNEANPAYCRTNGTGPTAATSVASTVDGDYNYPWAPPGINPANGSSTALAIAQSKVGVGNVWATAQDAKYFYENDNILWCDATNAAWPHQGPMLPSTCLGFSSVAQTCQGVVPHSCNGGAPQACDGIQSQTCNPAVTQTCDAAPQTCNFGGARHCDIHAQTCNGLGPQTCDAGNAQTCDGYQPQICGLLTSQSCVLPPGQTCNVTPGVCNLPAPASCPLVWVPAGCDSLPPGPENPDCHQETSCPPGSCNNGNSGISCTDDSPCPAAGSCSTDHLACTNSPNTCAALQGHCSAEPGIGCFDDSPCHAAGHCTTSGAVCHTAGDNPAECPTTDGHCSSTFASCQNLAGQCNPVSKCSLSGALCPPDGADPCNTEHGFCTFTGAWCWDNLPTSCPDTGTCAGAPTQACSVDATCPDVLGSCNVDGTVCNPTLGPAACGDAGHCSNSGAICHTAGSDPTYCPDSIRQCSVFGEVCDGITACPDHQGHCHVDTGIACLTGTCPVSGAQCDSAAHEACFPQAFACKSDNGTCNIDPAHPACIQGFAAGSGEIFSCPNYDTLGTCSLEPTRVCSSNAPGQCPSQPSASDAATCSDLLADTPTTVIVPIAIANPGFEAPFVPDYVNGLPGGAIAGSSWNFTGPYTGIQRFGGSFGATNSSDGAQTATIVNVGTVSQSVVLAPGSYRVSFLAARRLANTPVGSGNPIQVLVDGVPIGAPVVPTGDYVFTSFNREFNITTAGAHVIMFAGTDNSTLYKTSFLDAVTLHQGKSLLDDANSTGIVCRHNNNSGAYSSGRYDFPNSTYNTPVSAGTGSSACVASPRYALIPHHYWKTSVEWCDHAVSGLVAETPKWLGYGERSLVSGCQDDQDDGHTYPRFYQFGAPATTDNVAIPAMLRVDMDIATPAAVIFDHGLDAFGDPIQRHFDGLTPDVSEMTNYANWFAYYRTRIKAVKTVTSISFKEIDSKYRVGFETLVDKVPTLASPSDIPPSFVNIAQFDDAVGQKTNWYAKLFGITLPLGNETPTLSALTRVGEYFRTGSHPRLVGSVDPIILSCSKNYHLLFTDGFTNESGVPTDVIAGDKDDTIPDYPYRATFPITSPVPLVMGNPWPHPFRENAPLDVVTTTANSLSDYAMYYWLTDFQPPRGSSLHNVLPSDADPATWQHLNFAAVSLGTTGKLPATQQSVTEANLTSGALQWPVPSPNVFRPDNSGVDDLWHAAINGRGQFVNAQSVDEVKLGIGQVLADIAAQAGSRAGAGLQGVNIGASNNFAYRAKFEPGWAGDVVKVQLDPVTGAQVLDLWNSATQLAAQLVPAAAPNDKPWFSNRRIVTMTHAGVAVPFLWASLQNEQKDSLFPPATASKVAREKLVVEFLRGNPANEGTKLGQFRKRKSPFGDIVDSSPVYVGIKPNSGYRDGDDPGYAAFRAGLTRPARVYVGANDGMLHAIDDSTGNEAWAYIPSVLYRGGLESFRVVDDPLAGDAKAGLGALAYQQGALPPFKHHYMVDGPIRVGDVAFGAPSSGDWHTILVSGMGKGGNRYFALDVTDPAQITDEASAVSKVLWEFSAPQMGFTYGKAMLAKTRAFGGIWLVIVASGYNNPDGHGYLYFIRASDGHLMKTMTTNGLDGGGPSNPSGLAHPAGYTQDFRNQLAEQIYAGDLLGDFWRFDVSNSDDALWTVGKIAQLLDPSDNPQPVTTPPQIEVDASNGVDRWVFVGTGKLYDDSDLPNHQVQTMYALRDGTQTAPIPFPGPFPLNWHVLTPLGTTAATKFGLSSKPDKGWYDNLPGGLHGQRIVVPPQAALTVVAWIGTSAQDDPCLTGQTANVYARLFSNGQTVLFDGGGVAQDSVAVAEGGVGLEILGFDTAPGATQPDLRLAITLGTTGEVRIVRIVLPPDPQGHRMSWRLLGQ